MKKLLAILLLYISISVAYAADTNIYFVLDTQHAWYDTAIVRCENVFKDYYPKNNLGINIKKDGLRSIVKVRGPRARLVNLKGVLEGKTGLVVRARWRDEHNFISERVYKKEWTNRTALVNNP